MAFDPTKTATVEIDDIKRYRRDQRWQEIKLYAKVMLIAGIITAIALWVIINKFAN